MDLTLDYFLTRLSADDVVDILLVTLMIYSLLTLIRGTRAVSLLRGLLVLASILTSLATGLWFRWRLANEPKRFA